MNFTSHKIAFKKIHLAYFEVKYCVQTKTMDEIQIIQLRCREKISYILMIVQQ